MMITIINTPIKKGLKRVLFKSQEIYNDYLSLIIIPSTPAASAIPLLLDFNSM